MNEELKPILVGRDDEKISTEIELWEKLLVSVGDFFIDWKHYFGEDLSLEEFKTFQAVEDKPFYLGEKYVSKQKEYADFMKKLKIKIRKLLDMVEIPNFDHLLAGSQQAANWMLRVHADDLHRWFDQCHTANGFIFPPKLQAEITEKHSVYASTEPEILTYHFLNRFSGLLNVLSDAGSNFDATDFPPYMVQHMMWTRGNPIGKDKYSRHCAPGINLFRGESGLVKRLGNLPKERILELITEFSGEDVFHN